jgi:hypothetical protein
MASRNPQTAAKRAREQVLKEKRELKRAKKAGVAAERAAAKDAPPEVVSEDGDSEAPASPASPSAPEGGQI